MRRLVSSESPFEEKIGFSRAVRIRVMLRDIETWEAAARAHSEVFSDIRPACTFVQVSRFIDPEWLVEVEADCVASDSSCGRPPG